MSATRADGLFALLTLNEQATNGQQRQELLARLETKLEKAPLYASHANWLTMLTNCYNQQSCNIEEQELMRLMRLMRVMVNHNNIDKRGNVGAVIYAIAADFMLYSGKGSYHEMMALMTAAVAANPDNPEFRLSLIDKALTHGDYETATRWIDDFYRRRIHAYSHRIEQLEKRLPSASP